MQKNKSIGLAPLITASLLVLSSCSPKIHIRLEDPSHSQVDIYIDKEHEGVMEPGEEFTERVNSGVHLVEPIPRGSKVCPWTDNGAGFYITVDDEAILTLLPDDLFPPRVRHRIERAKKMIPAGAKIVFWSSLGLLSYTYAGYPLLIHALASARPKKVSKDKCEPTVSVVVAAHNEAARIGPKIENLLTLDYPEEKLQIVVVSDGSDDGTDKVVESYAGKGVKLVRQEEKGGKPQAINKGILSATGEIVLFCDVRQRIDNRAISALAEWFTDPNVGAVSGELEIEGEMGPSFYWRYEKSIRAAEGTFDSVPGATGALFAIRRSLFEQIPADSLLDDVFTPMQIMLKGFRIGFEPSAKVYDTEADLDGEFQRKARTLAGNFQLLEHLPSLLNPLRNRIFWQFTSHKLLRLLCPFALVGLAGSTLVLVVTPSLGWPLYASAGAGQLAAYTLAAHAALAPKKSTRLGRMAHTFVVLNGAAVEGLRRYIKGDFSWTRAKTS